MIECVDLPYTCRSCREWILRLSSRRPFVLRWCSFDSSPSDSLLHENWFFKKEKEQIQLNWVACLLFNSEHNWSKRPVEADSRNKNTHTQINLFSKKGQPFSDVPSLIHFITCLYIVYDLTSKKGRNKSRGENNQGRKTPPPPPPPPPHHFSFSADGLAGLFFSLKQ